MGGRFFGPGWHGGFQLFGGLFGIVLFALFIGLLVWALMRLMNHDHARHAPAGGPRQDRSRALPAAPERPPPGALDPGPHFPAWRSGAGLPPPPQPPAPPHTPRPPHPPPH